MSLVMDGSEGEQVLSAGLTASWCKFSYHAQFEDVNTTSPEAEMGQDQCNWHLLAGLSTSAPQASVT